MTPLAGWDNFYVIVGGSAGALIGLQFVAMALVADLPVNPAIETNDAFSTPTIVHFGAVLLVSALMNAPWHGAAHALRRGRRCRSRVRDRGFAASTRAVRVQAAFLDTSPCHVTC